MPSKLHFLSDKNESKAFCITAVNPFRNQIFYFCGIFILCSSFAIETGEPNETAIFRLVQENSIISPVFRPLLPPPPFLPSGAFDYSINESRYPTKIKSLSNTRESVWMFLHLFSFICTLTSLNQASEETLSLDYLIYLCYLKLLGLFDLFVLS